MSISIEEYMNKVSEIAATYSQQGSSQSVATSTGAKDADGDSYISTVSDSEAALPCENYNDILTVMQSAKSEGASSENAGDGTGASASGATASSGAVDGGSGSGGSDDDEDETTTKIVTINGVMYLETTTTENGVTTVTSERIGSEDE